MSDSTNSSATVDEHNRRAWFRIDDMVHMKSRALDDEEYQRVANDFAAHRMRYSVNNHLTEERIVMSPKLKAIERRHPEIAAYLKHLEKQIDTLGKRLSRDDVFDTESEPMQVNISAQGIRYDSPVEVAEGGWVEVGVMLLPSRAIVISLGKVVRCAPIEKDTEQDTHAGAGVGQAASYTLSVNFELLHPEDQETLVRHIHELQRLGLQTRQIKKG